MLHNSNGAPFASDAAIREFEIYAFEILGILTCEDSEMDHRESHSEELDNPP